MSGKKGKSVAPPAGKPVDAPVAEDAAPAVPAVHVPESAEGGGVAAALAPPQPPPPWLAVGTQNFECNIRSHTEGLRAAGASAQPRIFAERLPMMVTLMLCSGFVPGNLPDPLHRQFNAENAMKQRFPVGIGFMLRCSWRWHTSPTLLLDENLVHGDCLGCLMGLGGAADVPGGSVADVQFWEFRPNSSSSIATLFRRFSA